MINDPLGRIFAKPVVRYLFSGGSAFLTEYAVFLVLFSGLSVWLYAANSLSFFAGLIVSFTLNRSWTFKQDNFKRSARQQMTMYALMAAFNLAAINVLIGLLDHLGLDPRIGKIVVMVAVAAWNFVIFRSIVFVKK